MPMIKRALSHRIRLSLTTLHCFAFDLIHTITGTTLICSAHLLLHLVFSDLTTGRAPNLQYCTYLPGTCSSDRRYGVAASLHPPATPLPPIRFPSLWQVPIYLPTYLPTLSALRVGPLHRWNRFCNTSTPPSSSEPPHSR